MADRARGGLGDGPPSQPDGEPLLHRWFVVAMLALSVVAIGLTVFALAQRSAPPAETFPAAQRRNPGTAQVTHERGQIVLAEDDTVSMPVTCAENVRLVGDEGGRATLRRAFGVLCQQLADDDGSLAQVARGLAMLDEQDGIVRVAQAEATGIDSSARIEDGVPVVEIAPKFQFENARVAAPFLAHELFHLGGDLWPGRSVGASDELGAMRAQAEVCGALRAPPDELPRGCDDAEQLLAADDPLQSLRDAGFPG